MAAIGGVTKVRPEDKVADGEAEILPGSQGGKRERLADFTGLGAVLPELGLASVVVNILGLALPLMVLQIYDRIIPHQSASTLGLLTLGVVAALILEGLVRVGRNYVTGWVGATFEHKVSCAAVHRLLNAETTAIEAGGAGAHLERLRAAAPVREFYSGQSLLSLFDLPFAAVYLGLIWYLGGPLVAVPLGLLAVFGVTAYLNGRQLKEAIRARMILDERRFSFIAEVLSGIHSVKSMAMEAMIGRRYELLQEANVQQGFDGSRHSIAAVNLGALFSQISTVLVVAAGALLVVGGAMTPGALAACIMLAGRSIQPLQGALSVWHRFQTFVVARERLEQVFAIDKADSIDNPPLPPIEGAIDLEDVVFRFDEHGEPLFPGLDVHIAAGECVAIVGDNGSGKSSLLSLMAGMLPPTGGMVRVDGIDLAEHAPSSLPLQIAYLPQQGVLFDGSILDNLTMYDRTLETRAIGVAQLLGLDQVVAGMRNGYNTVVANGSSETVPSGIKQRIAIARALVHDPRVILFDEANSALDSQGDELLRQYLESRKGHCTMVLVTHRPSLLKLADRVLTLKDGIVAAASETPAALPAALPAQAPGPAPQTAMTAAHPRPRGDNRLASTVMDRFQEQTDLSVCLVGLLTALEWNGSPRQLAESLPHVVGVLDLHSFNKVMANLRFTSQSTRTTLARLDPRLLPCLFLPDDGDAQVLVRHDDETGHFFAFDGGRIENRELAADDTAGEVHVYRPLEAPARASERGSWVRDIFARFRPLMWLTVAVTLVINLMALAVPGYVMVTFNSILPAGDDGLVKYLVLGMVIAIGMDTVVRRLRARIQAYIGARTEFILGNAIFQRILALPAWATEQVTVGGQLARIKDFEALRDLFTGPIAVLAYDLFGVVVFVIALVAINPWLIVVILTAMAAYALLGLASQPIMSARNQASARLASQRNEFLSDMLSKVRAVKYAGAEDRWYERFRQLSGKAVAAEFKSQQLGSVLGIMAQSISLLTGLATMVVCVVGTFSGSTSVGAVVASMLVTWRLVAPLQSGFMSLSTIHRVASSMRQIDNLMRMNVESEPDALHRAPPNFKGELSFSRVSFRYTNEADPALLGVSLQIRPRQVLAIAGPNGAGKSTILKLITGLYNPQAGSVRIDNVDVRQLDPMDLRSLIAYAPQRCDIFYGTIAQNLRLAHPTASEAELEWATKLAGLHDDILAMPRGFDTRITDGQGEHLPNGFRQRLSLARAYLRPAPIMLFDEPGNGLDNEGDQAFMAALAQLKRDSTIILVSHRPSHLRMADQVIYMEGGYVRQVGTFDQVKPLVMGTLR